jgi:hypothetical protein
MTQVLELGQLQQATTGTDGITNCDGPIAMDAINAITNRNGHN